MTATLPYSPTNSQRSAIMQAFKIDNAVSTFRKEQEHRLAKLYLTVSALFYLIVLLVIGRTLVYTNVTWVAAAFVLLVFLVFLVFTALFVERLVLDSLLTWHLEKRFSPQRCWDLILRREGGISAFPAQMMYTEHPFAVHEVRNYLEQRCFTDMDREVTDVILNDETTLTLEEIVDTAISLR